MKNGGENCIRRAFRADAQRINHLRITEFSRSDDFSLLLPDSLLWGAIDEDSIILAAWDQSGTAVSTMRAVTVWDASEAMTDLECHVPDEVAYPSVIFNSAATRKSNRGKGLNQAIRYYFLEAALRADIKTLLSPVYLGAPRTAFMKKLGYRFLEPDKTWQKKLQPHAPRLLAILERRNFRNALTIIREERKETLLQYPWRGEPFEFQLRPS